MKLDRMITTTNETPEYFQCWALNAQITKKMFNCNITLGFITDKDETDPMILKMKKFGDVLLFKPIPNIPTANQAKMTRLWLSTQYEDEICMINDIDIVILQNIFLLKALDSVPDNNLMTIGRNAYNHFKVKGRFPMIYTSAMGKTFKEIVNPHNMNYNELFESWIGIKQLTSIEDISNDPRRFSDECLLRVLLNRWNNPDRINHIPRNFVMDRAIERIDRVNWNIDINKLRSNWYIDAHLPRPLYNNIQKVKPILDHFNITEI